MLNSGKFVVWLSVTRSVMVGRCICFAFCTLVPLNLHDVFFLVKFSWHGVVFYHGGSATVSPRCCHSASSFSLWAVQCDRNLRHFAQLFFLEPGKGCEKRGETCLSQGQRIHPDSEW